MMTQQNTEPIPVMDKKENTNMKYRKKRVIGYAAIYKETYTLPTYVSLQCHLKLSALNTKAVV